MNEAKRGNYCLAKALCICAAKEKVNDGEMGQSKFDNYKRDLTKELEKDAIALHKNCIGNLQNPVSLDNIVKFEEFLNVHVLVVKSRRRESNCSSLRVTR